MKPIYLSSIIVEDKGKQLNSCASELAHWYVETLNVPVVKYLKGGNPLSNDFEGDINAKSDCDGHTPGAKHESWGVEEEKEV